MCMDKKWFKPKSYGWGWTPSSKEGWFVIVFFLIVMFATIPLAEKDPFVYSVLLTLEVAVLIVITTITGEKPEWRWGGKKVNFKKLFKKK